MSRAELNPNPGVVTQASTSSRVTPNANPTVGSVAENVSSLLNGIGAWFRSENVNVMPKPKSKKSLLTTNSDV